MRIAVTGKQGQVALCLKQMAQERGVDVLLIGRPELDLGIRRSVFAALAAARPDVIVSAAAFTAVDLAESLSEEAFSINAAGAEAVAAAADRLDVPLIHLSTDYVFNGRKSGAYQEADEVDPRSVYGRSKLAGEFLVAAQTHNHAILRTAWVYSPFGRNFVKTMMRLGETSPSVRVVADQFGCPTSACDIADAVISISRSLAADSGSNLRGVFHLCGSGSASWADFADFIFDHAVNHRRHPVRVERIGTTDYPLPAPRPANSQLCCDRLEAEFGIRLPHWKSSAAKVIDVLMEHSERALS